MNGKGTGAVAGAKSDEGTRKGRSTPYPIARIRWIATHYPSRWRRFSDFVRRRNQRSRPAHVPFGLEFLFLALDLLLVPDLYELLSNLLTPRLRLLTPGELHFLHPIFGDSVRYDLIRIDERAHLGPRTRNFCYVGMHTINSWGPLHPTTLVHEVVHVWQYLHRGAVYIPRALAAQRTFLGYNYGGLAGLHAAAELEDFNYEQMADVVEDAFRLSRGWPAQWMPGRGAEVLPEFARFLEEITKTRLN